MNLQARRSKGGVYTSEDILEVKLNRENEDLNNATFYLEVVSGPEVTHGGGAPSSEQLNYVSLDAITGVGDTVLNMPVVQASKGTSVVRVVVKYMSTANTLGFKELYDAWVSNGGVAPTPVQYSTSTSGEISLDWGNAPSI
jgi:hypothetical protein